MNDSLLKLTYQNYLFIFGCLILFLAILYYEICPLLKSLLSRIIFWCVWWGLAIFVVIFVYQGLKAKFIYSLSYSPIIREEFTGDRCKDHAEHSRLLKMTEPGIIEINCLFVRQEYFNAGSGSFLYKYSVGFDRFDDDLAFWKKLGAQERFEMKDNRIYKVGANEVLFYSLLPDDSKMSWMSDLGGFTIEAIFKDSPNCERCPRNYLWADRSKREFILKASWSN
jgi:hypothetical protein